MDKPTDSKTIDDAGRPFEPIDARQAAESGDQALRQVVLRAIAIQQQKAFGKTTIMYVLLMVGGAVAGILVATSLQLKDPWPQVCAVASVCVWIVPLVRSSKASLSGTLTDQLVIAGRCGACGYLLHDLSEKDGELAVCPECGASWRKSRFTRIVSGPVQPPIAEGGFALTTRGIRVIVIDLDRKGFPAPRIALPGAESWLGETADQVRRELRRRLLPKRLGQTLLTLSISFVVAVLFLLPPPPGNSRPGATDGSGQLTTAMMIGLIVGGLAFTAQMVRIWSGRTFGQCIVAKRILIDRGLCGSCARKLRSADDGQTYLPCEGCGGRWPVTILPS